MKHHNWGESGNTKKVGWDSVETIEKLLFSSNLII